MKKPLFFERSELSRSLWAFRREFIWVGVFSLVANLLMLTPSIYMLQIFDRVLTSRSETTLIVVTTFLVVFIAVMAFADWIRSRLLVRTGTRMDRELNPRVFTASFDAYLRHHTGRNPAEAFSSLTTLRQFLTGQGVIAFFDTPWTVIYIVVIFFIHPLLGWLSILFAGIQLCLTWMSNRVTVKDIERAAVSGTDSVEFARSKLRNIEPIHAMGMLGNMRKRWLDFHGESFDKGSISIEKQERQQSLTKFVRYSMQSLTLGAAALLVIDGRLTPGAMIVANLLMARVLQPLDLLVSTWKMFVHAKMAFLQLETVFEEFPERAAGINQGEPQGHISLHNLSATAPGRDTPILDGISVDIPPGKIVVMVGPSGSGKSTLARCMLGIWPDIEGEVLIDGQKIESLDRKELGPHIGYLPQDIELFEGSIAENIARFGKVVPDKVVRAAQRTGIHEMILRFPGGYDTEIGMAGGMLSAGQRQRIGLARAMYGNPAFIVLDEPNANLDDAGDQALVRAIDDLKMQGKTVVLISHRPYIVKVADFLLVLRDGKVAHFGPRDAVLAEIRPHAAAKPTESMG